MTTVKETSNESQHTLPSLVIAWPAYLVLELEEHQHFPKTVSQICCLPICCYRLPQQEVGSSTLLRSATWRVTHSTCSSSSEARGGSSHFWRGMRMSLEFLKSNFRVTVKWGSTGCSWDSGGSGPYGTRHILDGLRFAINILMGFFFK